MTIRIQALILTLTLILPAFKGGGGASFKFASSVSNGSTHVIFFWQNDLVYGR